jgi:glycosyltransferase involved in cell wall biosynthesis
MIPKVLLFELSADGHYPNYVRYLVEGWNSRRGHLVVVVSQRFAERHGAWIMPERPGVSWQVLSPAETQMLAPRRYPWQRIRRAFQEWELLDRYIRRLGADHCLLPYLDSRRWPLLFRQSLSCGLTAIYFRPSFHYDRLQGQPSRWQYRLERCMVKQMLHHPALKTVLCLDGSALVPLAGLNPQVQVNYLPDPVAAVRATPQQVETLRQRLKVEPGRRVLLFFGAIHRRKGIYPLLRALRSIGAEAGQQLCLVLAGEIDPLDAQRVQRRLQQLPHSIQIICQDQYLAESDLPAYFQMADLVLALYQHHVGMSGVLLRAAVAGRPLLCDRHGLIGDLTERYQLGQVVDATNPHEIARILVRWLQSPRLSCCQQSMQEFAWLHRDSQFASILLESIFATGGLTPVAQKISQPAPAASLG